MSVFLRLNPIGLAALACSLLGAPVLAQEGPLVNVSLSKSLSARAEEIGLRDLEYLKKDLREEVVSALAHAKGGPLHPREIDLVIEDCRPNRPTSAQLGANPGLSMRSLSIGGARIGGRLIDADGHEHLFHIGYFETDIRNDRGATVWSDTYQAFDMVAHRIATGRLDGE